MKLLLLCMLLTLNSAIILGQPSDPEIANDPLRKRLKGNVLSVTTTFGEKGRDGESHFVGRDSTIAYFFNDNMLEKKVFYGAYGLMETESYFYDSLNNLKRTIALDGKGRQAKEILYDYNREGKLSKLLDKRESSEGYEITFEYDHGRMISQRLRYLESNQLIIHSYKFDKNGNMIEEIEEIPGLSYGTAGYSKKLYQYSGLNLLTKEQKYTQGNEPETTIIYTYDKSKLLVKAEMHHQDPSTYDNVKTYRYDNGNLIEFFEDYQDETLDRRQGYAYKFDQKGNLVEKMMYVNGTLQMHIKCRIEYR